MESAFVLRQIRRGEEMPAVHSFFSQQKLVSIGIGLRRLSSLANEKRDALVGRQMALLNNRPRARLPDNAPGTIDERFSER